MEINYSHTMILADNRWCCAEGREAGGQGTLSSPYWTVELYSQHAMDTETLILEGLQPTRLVSILFQFKKSIYNFQKPS